LISGHKNAFGVYALRRSPSKCPYYDFNSHPVCPVDEERFASAFAREIETTPRARPRSVLDLFGGGAVRWPQTVGILIDRQAPARVASDVEVNQANPQRQATRFPRLSFTGVNRVSLACRRWTMPR
jgi:oxygen-independent coproporphyrinogen-3 oxidase